MIKTKKINKTERIPVSFTCDLCKKTYKCFIKDSHIKNGMDKQNFFETQEFHFFNFVGGYGSVCSLRAPHRSRLPPAAVNPGDRIPSLNHSSVE